jgi:hypothetical protein
MRAEPELAREALRSFNTPRYTGMCGSNGHGLTIHVSFMVKCVRYMRAVDPLVS